MKIIEWINNFEWLERSVIYFTSALFCFATYNHFRHGQPLNNFFERLDELKSKTNKNKS